MPTTARAPRPRRPLARGSTGKKRSTRADRKKAGLGDVAAGFAVGGWQGEGQLDAKLDDMPELFRRAASAMKAIDINHADLSKYADWAPIIMAAAGATGKCELFWTLAVEPWAAQKGADNVTEARRVWDSEDEFQVGWAKLKFYAREHGKWKDPKPDAELEADNKDRVDTFMSDWVYVGGELKRFINVHTREMLDKESFADLYRDIWARKGGTAQFRYIQSKERRFAQDVTYAPNKEFLFTDKEGKLLVNIWQPSSLKPVEGDIGPWMELMTRIYPDERVRGLLMDWMAFNIQHPELKCNWHPLIAGAGGIGKDTTFEPLVRGMGKTNCWIIGANELSGQWTHYLEGKLVIVEELNAVEKKEQLNKLKPLEAAPPFHVSINKKNVAQYQLPNLISFVYFSNYRDALKMDDDDRRHMVYWSPCPETKEGTPEHVARAKWFAEFYAWLDAGGDAHVVHWLMARDVSKFSYAGHAPWTESKGEMIRETQSDGVRWLVELIEGGKCPLFSGEFVQVSTLLCDLDPPQGMRMTDKVIMAALRHVKAVALPQIDMASGTVDKRKDGDGQRKRQWVRVWAMQDGERYKAMDVDELRELIRKDLADAMVRPAQPDIFKPI